MAKKNALKLGYTVAGWPYRVRDHYRDSGIPGWKEVPAKWWEYRVTLLRNGRTVTQWDSLVETYNGMQQLTYNQCRSSIAEIKRDVERGKIEDWFGKGAWGSG